MIDAARSVRCAAPVFAVAVLLSAFGGPAASPAASPAGRAERTQDPRPGDERRVSGVIAEVDPHLARVTVDDPVHGPVTFDVPGEATIVLDGETGAIAADLFPGDTVLEAHLKASRTGRWYLVSAEVSSTG